VRQTPRQRDIHTYIPTYIQADRQRRRNTYRHRQTDTDRYSTKNDRETERQKYINNRIV